MSQVSQVHASEAHEKKEPILFAVVKWYGYVFSLTFVLYGGVKLVLGFLDRKYDDAEQLILFLLLGVILLVICFAFKDRKSWGWYGMIGINGLVVLLALFGLSNIFNVVLLVLSLAALGALLHPAIKDEIIR